MSEEPELFNKRIYYKQDTQKKLLILAGMHTNGNLIKYISDILDEHVEASGVQLPKPQKKKVKSKGGGVPITEMSPPR